MGLCDIITIHTMHTNARFGRWSLHYYVGLHSDLQRISVYPQMTAGNWFELANNHCRYATAY